MSTQGAATGAVSGALSGAAAGASFGPYGAVIGGVVGGISGGLSGSSQGDSLDSYQKMLDAQLEYAKSRSDLAQTYAKPTLAELRIMANQMQIADQQLKRQEAILASIDPSILEAGHQILAIQKGQNTKIIQPFLQQRAEQRGRLIASLQNQVGPGAASSSIGQDSLRKFDQDTALQTQQLQQASLNTLMGVITGDTAATDQVAGLANQSQLNAFNSSNTLQQRMINTITGIGYGNVAGNQFAGGVARGAAGQAGWADVLKAGGQLAGTFANRAPAGAAPTSAPSLNSYDLAANGVASPNSMDSLMPGFSSANQFPQLQQPRTLNSLGDGG